MHRLWARRAALASSPVALAYAGQKWRSFQQLTDGESTEKYECNLITMKELTEFAKRNLLFEWGKLDIRKVRSWHLENARPGGVVLREVEVEPDEVDHPMTQWREGYYLYYETSGKGERCEEPRP